MLNLLDIIGLPSDPGAVAARPFDLRGETAGTEAGAEFTEMFAHLMARFDVLGAPDTEAPPAASHMLGEPARQTVEASPDDGASPLPEQPLANDSGPNIRSLAREGQFVPELTADEPNRPPVAEVSSADGGGRRNGIEPKNSDAVLRMSLPTEIVTTKNFVPIDTASLHTPSVDTDAHAAARPAGDVPPRTDTGVVRRGTVRPRPLPIPDIAAREAAPIELHRVESPPPVDIPARAGRETEAVDVPKMTTPTREAAPVRFVPLEGEIVRPRPEFRNFQIRQVQNAVVGDDTSQHERPTPIFKHALPADTPAVAPRAMDHVEKAPVTAQIEAVAPKPAMNDALPVRRDVRPDMPPDEGKQKTVAERTPRGGIVRIDPHEPLHAIEPAERQPAIGHGRPQPAAVARYMDAMTTHSQDLSRRALSSVEGDFVESYRPIETGTGATPVPFNPGIGQEPRGATLVSGVESLGKTIEQEVLGSLRRLDSPNEEFAAEIRLQPRELGSVKIRISVSDHRVELQLAVDSKEVRQLVQSHSNELRAVLEHKGYSLTDINVFVSGERDGSGGLEDRSDHAWSQSAHASAEADEDAPSSLNNILTEKRVNILA